MAQAAIIRFNLNVYKMTRQCGCCTTVVVQNEIKIKNQDSDEPLCILIGLLEKNDGPKNP